MKLENDAEFKQLRLTVDLRLNRMEKLNSEVAELLKSKDDAPRKAELIIAFFVSLFDAGQLHKAIDFYNGHKAEFDKFSLNFPECTALSLLIESWLTSDGNCCAERGCQNSESALENRQRNA